MENIFKTKTFSFISSFIISFISGIIPVIYDIKSYDNIIAFCVIGIIASMAFSCIKEYDIGDEIDFKNIMYSFIGCICSIAIIFFIVLFNLLK